MLVISPTFYFIRFPTFLVHGQVTIIFVLYCRSRPKADKSRHFDPHFEEVRGGIEPWLMARWKARVEFLLSVIGLLFLSLTIEALQGKMCQNLLPLGVGRSLGGS